MRSTNGEPCGEGTNGAVEFFLLRTWGCGVIGRLCARFLGVVIPASGEMFKMGLERSSSPNA